MKENGSRYSQQGSDDPFAELLRRITLLAEAEGNPLTPCVHASDADAHEDRIWRLLDGDLDPETEDLVHSEITDCAWCAKQYLEQLAAHQMAEKMPRRSLLDELKERAPEVVPRAEQGHPVQRAIRFVFRAAKSGLEVISCPGTLIAQPVPSRGEGTNASEIEYEVSGHKISLLVTSYEGTLNLQLVSEPKDAFFEDVICKILVDGEAGRIADFEKNQETGAYVWESNDIPPGEYELLFEGGSGGAGKKTLGSWPLVLEGPESDDKGTAR
ncbi:hypothetical protein ACFL6M_03650 [Candidatus Eisenbacteria bacterium]|uniref:Zinc-finger domain-containing protein n=1 Tax=Eiseniibacteriota bacterium TaxID=2212470 RepID=A0ABV6YK20_UNCEI